MKNENLIKSVRESIADIALTRLRENGKGFYTVDLGIDMSSGIPWFEAEAGFRITGWFKFSGIARYEPGTGKIILGTRIGGEISL